VRARGDEAARGGPGRGGAKDTRTAAFAGQASVSAVELDTPAQDEEEQPKPDAEPRSLCARKQRSAHSMREKDVAGPPRP
jgi:hypothetical protein